MRKSNILAAAACLSAALYLAGADVPGHISSGYATFNNGLIVRYDLVLEPPLKNSDVFLPTTGVSTEGNRMHRSLGGRGFVAAVVGR